jgi:hypothetical protein
MSARTQEKSPQTCSESSGWNYAISEAKRKIAESEAKIVRLRNSILTFEEMKKAGEPWRGEKLSKSSKSEK